MGWLEQAERKLEKCMEICEVIVKENKPPCLCLEQTEDLLRLVHDVRILGLQEGEQGEEPVVAKKAYAS